MKSMSFVMKKT